MKITEIKRIAEADAVGRKYAASKYSFWNEAILSMVFGRVLDVGSGDGAFTIPLLGENYDVVSSDISHSRLLNLKPVQPLLVECDATFLPFKPNTFDTLLFIEVLEHLPDRETQRKCLRGFLDVLKPGGRIILTTPNRPIYHIMLKLWELFGGQKPDPTHFSELSIKDLLSLLGEVFDIIEVKGKIGILPFNFIQKIFSSFPWLCYDIMVVAKRKNT